MNPAEAGRLRLGDELGSGAVASVHRVHEPERARVYAGKILHERHRRDPAAVARFSREAELARRLDHPNLVGVYGVCDVDGQRVLLMELVEGPTLAHRIATRSPLPERELVDLARGIANGLWVAHSAGVIHRDLKPANILLDSSEHGVVPKIADFGMARATSFAGVDRGALTVLGTPDYMAPECLDPLAVDPRADLYALGCIIVEMATGAPPYRGATPFAILEAHRGAEIPSLSEPYSPALRTLARRLLAKQPGDRPQSASAVVDALANLERGDGGDTATALVRADAVAGPRPDMVAAAEGKCARCGHPLVPQTGACFHCGLPLVSLERGPMTVFVVGPGRVGEKLPTRARERLLSWVRENPGVGLDPTPLEHEIPRMPFVFASNVSPASAQALEHSLGALGLFAQARVGGRFSHAAMLQKSALLGGRRSAIVAAIGFTPALLYLPIGLLSLLALTPVLSIVFGVTATRAAKPAMRVLPAQAQPLPPKLAARLEQLARVVVRVHEHRHRESLRAIVQRVLALVQAMPETARGEVDAEMDHALNLAIVATTRMDELDRQIGRPDFDDTDPVQREDLRERDMWAGRLLDLSATLDALASRRAAAQARLAAHEVEDALASIRVSVEALEEIRRG